MNILRIYQEEKKEEEKEEEEKITKNIELARTSSTQQIYSAQSTILNNSLVLINFN